MIDSEHERPTSIGAPEDVKGQTREWRRVRPLKEGDFQFKFGFRTVGYHNGYHTVFSGTLVLQ